MGQTPSQRAANYPISKDIEDRRGNRSTTPPPSAAPDLGDRIAKFERDFGTKTRMTYNWLRYDDPDREFKARNARELAAARKMYVPGRDAASVSGGRQGIRGGKGASGRTASFVGKKRGSGRRASGR
jgi:hypothetical protein